MHPVIWLVSFAIFSIFVSAAQAADLLLSCILLSIFYWALRIPWIPAQNMLRRMRWFFLSILFLYFWFTPGQPLAPGLPSWLQAALPSQPGLQEGITRLLALILIVLAANLLLRNSTQEQLLGAIHWLITPFAVLGLSADRLALRMVLTIEAVEKIQLIVSAKLSDVKGKGLRTTGQTTADVFNATVESAQQQPLLVMVIPEESGPALYQWVYPGILILLFLLL